VDPHGVANGPERRLTDHATYAYSASVSWDGSKITYRLRAEDGSVRAWFKDLANEKDHALQPRREPLEPPMISPAGSRVAFTAETEQGTRPPRNTISNELFVAPTDGGAGRRLCGDCGYASGWTPDGEGLLTVVRNIADERTKILRVDAESGKTSTLLSCRNCRRESSTLSQNGRWLLFENMDNTVTCPRNINQT
jgi:Tol biopolymer transport system component